MEFEVKRLKRNIEISNSDLDHKNQQIKQFNEEIKMFFLKKKFFVSKSDQLEIKKKPKNNFYQQSTYTNTNKENYQNLQNSNQLPLVDNDLRIKENFNPYYIKQTLNPSTNLLTRNQSLNGLNTNSYRNVNYNSFKNNLENNSKFLSNLNKDISKILNRDKKVSRTSMTEEIIGRPQSLVQNPKYNLYNNKMDQNLFPKNRHFSMRNQSPPLQSNANLSNAYTSPVSKFPELQNSTKNLVKNSILREMNRSFTESNGIFRYKNQ